MGVTHKKTLPIHHILHRFRSYAIKSVIVFRSVGTPLGIVSLKKERGVCFSGLKVVGTYFKKHKFRFLFFYANIHTCQPLPPHHHDKRLKIPFSASTYRPGVGELFPPFLVDTGPVLALQHREAHVEGGQSHWRKASLVHGHLGRQVAHSVLGEETSRKPKPVVDQRRVNQATIDQKPLQNKYMLIVSRFNDYDNFTVLHRNIQIP